MKITVKPEKVVEKVISLDEIEPGTVFEYDDATIGFKLVGKEIVLLKFEADGDDWLELADVYKDRSVKRILGTIDEIVVVKQ